MDIFIVRDLIDGCTSYDLTAGFISLDQDKAFSQVDHGYLFFALKASGFGGGFLAWVNLMYRDAQVLIKLGAGLNRRLPVRRGIRQGCALSGQLYSLAIEPLLVRLRERPPSLSGGGGPPDEDDNSICEFPEGLQWHHLAAADSQGGGGGLDRPAGISESPGHGQGVRLPIPVHLPSFG